MKRFLLAATAVMSTAAFAFGAEEPVFYPDTVHAMPIVHADGWSASKDETSSVEVTGAAGSEAVITLTRAIKPETGDVYACVRGAMFPSDADGTPTGGSLAKFRMLVIGYSVPNATDTLSIGIAKDWETGIGEPDWNYFHALSTKGASAPGTMVYDTIALDEFFISWAGNGYAESAKLSSTEAASYLATCNNFVIRQENGDYAAEQVLTLTLKEINFIGETGLRTDMGLAASNISGFDVSNGAFSNVVTGITNNSVNLSVPTSGNYDISLFSANGRMVQSTTANLLAGSAGSVSLKEQSAGVYFVQVVGQSLNVTEKVTLR